MNTTPAITLRLNFEEVSGSNRLSEPNGRCGYQKFHREAWAGEDIDIIFGQVITPILGVLLP